jgi:putative ABC transport system permease protein
VRTALGASRRRVATQLFAEALVLSSLASALGLTIAALGFDVLRDLLTGGGEGIPFWVSFSLSPALIVYVAGLAVLAAGIVGVVPALKATGRGVQSNLQQLSSRVSGMRLGSTWTGLIVFQVAVAVGVLPYALWGGGRLSRSATAEPDYAIDAFLQASVSIESSQPAPPADSAEHDAARAARFAAGLERLVARLEAQPQVAGVALASSYPGNEAYYHRMQLEGVEESVPAWINYIDADLLSVFDVPILAGRGFVAADAASGSNTALVDRIFADEVLGGGNVVGRRIRHVARGSDGSTAPGEWLEIVGVVPAFTPPPAFEDVAPKLYRPLAHAPAAGAVQLAVRTKPGTPPASFTGTVREIARVIDPALQVRELRSAAESDRLLRKGLLSMAIGIAAITGSVLLLSAAGIYAMMSFTVASRRREIGIRSALGAAPRRVLAGVFRRAGAQLGAGVLAGLALAEAIPRLGGGSFFAGEGMFTLIPVVTIVLAIGLLAAFGPARRGLAIQPIEALRED